jgi:hypothetical protein
MIDLSYFSLLQDIDFVSYFNCYGGLALGLLLAQQLANEFENVRTPNLVVIEKEDILTNQHEKILSSITPVLNRKVVCKLSGIDEPFSPRSTRGANSSLLNPRFVITKELKGEDIARLISLDNLYHHRAIVLQELTEITNDVGVIIVHSNEDEVIVEIPFGEHRYLFTSKHPGCIQHAESTHFRVLSDGQSGIFYFLHPNH